MARYPAAIWKPLDPRYVPGARLTAHNRVNLHVAVSEAASLHGFFNAPGRPSSHFYVRRDGTVEQYVDTDYRAEADLDGNDATISVETQGGVTDAQREPWTDEQVQALAALWAWARDTHGIADKLATSSRRGEESRGLSWHRLGVDPWRVPDGMRYSTARGKICPGDAKIAQIPGILAAANGGASPVVNPVTPKPTPAPKPAPVAPAGGLVVDGKWGAATARALQAAFGTTVDGVISHQWRSRHNENIYSAQFDRTKTGSQLIRAMQRWLGVDDDGLCGPGTITALQRRLGTPADGVISPVSSVVREMQARLNAGTLR